METNLDTIEEILRVSLAERKARPCGGCPAPEDLVRFVEEGAGRKARARMMEHVADCPDCAQILQSVLRLSGEIDRLAGASEAGQSRPTDVAGKNEERLRPRTFLGRRPAVAVLAGLIGLTIITFSVIRLSERSAVRGTIGPEIKLISPKKGDSLAVEDVRFVWEAVPKASCYLVELFGRSLEKVWRSDPLPDPRAELPSEAGESLHEGETYFWRVTAVLGDGQEMVSKLAEFSIRKKSP